MFKRTDYINNSKIISKVLELDAINRSIEINKISHVFSYLEEVREYIATNNIEGDIISESKAQQFLKENVKPPLSDKELFDRWIGIKYASDYLWSESFSFDLEHIKALHRVLMSKSPVAGGVYKSKINQVGSLITTHPEDVEKKMSALMINFQASVIAEGYNVFNIVAFTSEFLAIHPFEDGNGRMSRLLFNYLIFLAGFKFAKYFSISKFLWESKSEYINALEARNTPWGRNELKPDDLTPLFCILLDVLILVAKQVKSLQDLPKISKQEFVKQVLLLPGEFAFKDVRQSIRCINSDSTLKVWLSELVDAKQLELTGTKKSAKYISL